jgi:hypothetical protein
MIDKQTEINEHQLPTTYIKHLAVIGLSNVSARIKSSCNLPENRFEILNVSYTHPLTVLLLSPYYQNTSNLIK